jgi:hypothetical protein
MQEGELPPSDRVRAVFEDVLAGREFQYGEAAPWVRWLQAFVELLRDVLRRWWPDLGEPEIRLISWLALAVFIGLAVLMIHRWASGAERRSRGRSRAASDAAAEPLDARGWASRARSAAAAGRYREAATGLYQATILEMDAAGRLRYRDWKTPGDYALEIPTEDPARTGLLAFLSDFVTVAFGPVEPDASAFASLSSRAAALGSRV